MPNLRGRKAFSAVVGAIAAGRARAGGRVVHFSVQTNHVHLIVEAANGGALGRLVQGLCIRIARAVNRAFERRGRVFADRYHARALATPSEVNRALGYVLCNFQKHAGAAGGERLVGFMDGCSSALWFDGWSLSDAARRSIGLRRTATKERPVAEPRTWLLRTGYRRHGLLDPNRAPAADRAAPARRSRAAREEQARPTG